MEVPIILCGLALLVVGAWIIANWYANKKGRK